jgi:CysZ protein
VSTRAASDLQPSARRLGFVRGLSTLPRAFGFVARTRASWPLVAAPALLCAVLWSAAIALALRFAPQLWAATIGGHEAWVAGLRWLLDAASVVVAVVLGMFAALLLAPALSAPVLERLVLLRERALGAPPRAAAGLWRELTCALQAQLMSLALFGPALALLWLVTLLVPALSPVTFPLKFVVGALWLAVGLLDYPMSLRGLSFAQRWTSMRRNFGAVLGFALASACAFAVPLVSLLVLPIAVVAAAELALWLER